MKTIEHETFSEERALNVVSCRFAGEEDGESFLKECSDVTVKDCYMDLRYPLWHNERLRIEGGEMTEKCRAAIWYGTDITVEGCTMYGIKALRECKKVTLRNLKAVSPEFGWRCGSVDAENVDITSEYAFFESRGIRAKNFTLHGKYSFQYTKDVEIANSYLTTKDAFWHAENVTVRDSVIDGEYLGWYSDGLTLVNCHIKGTQPLCYCKRLRLIGCTTENCDLAFEYSDVDAEIEGGILSVKNPLSGRIAAQNFGEIILKDPKYPCRAQIVKKA